MPTVKYIGTFAEGQDSFSQGGFEFSREKPTANVPDKDDSLVKFEGNPFFVVGKETDENKSAADAAEKAEAESLKGWLAEHQVPVRQNASLDNLRKARADYEKAKADALKEG